MVRTIDFHSVDRGSIPLRGTIKLNMNWRVILIGKESVLKTDVVRLQSSSLWPSAIYAQIAQSVEQETENLRVRGSIPRLGTI